MVSGSISYCFYWISFRSFKF